MNSSDEWQENLKEAIRDLIHIKDDSFDELDPKYELEMRMGHFIDQMGGKKQFLCSVERFWFYYYLRKFRESRGIADDQNSSATSHLNTVNTDGYPYLLVDRIYNNGTRIRSERSKTGSRIIRKIVLHALDISLSGSVYDVRFRLALESDSYVSRRNSLEIIKLIERRSFLVQDKWLFEFSKVWTGETFYLAKQAKPRYQIEIEYVFNNLKDLHHDENFISDFAEQVCYLLEPPSNYIPREQRLGLMKRQKQELVPFFSQSSSSSSSQQLPAPPPPPQQQPLLPEQQYFSSYYEDDPHFHPPYHHQSHSSHVPPPSSSSSLRENSYYDRSQFHYENEIQSRPQQVRSRSQSRSRSRSPSFRDIHQNQTHQLVPMTFYDQDGKPIKAYVDSFQLQSQSQSYPQPQQLHLSYDDKSSSYNHYHYHHRERRGEYRYNRYDSSSTVGVVASDIHHNHDRNRDLDYDKYYGRKRKIYDDDEYEEDRYFRDQNRRYSNYFNSRYNKKKPKSRFESYEYEREQKRFKVVLSKDQSHMHSFSPSCSPPKSPPPPSSSPSPRSSNSSSMKKDDTYNFNIGKIT